MIINNHNGPEMTVSESRIQVRRREFLTTTFKLSVAFGLSSFPCNGSANANILSRTWTVGQIMDLFIDKVSGSPLTETVDTLKAGHREISVTGIVTTMFPTIEIIRKAIELKSNFIITHEPAYFNHADETGWLEKDDVFIYKKDLLNKHNIAVWRNHDYIHSHIPDGVYEGFIEASGWREFYKNHVFTIPQRTVRSVIEILQSKFNTGTLRYIGDLSQSCSTILYMPGAPGGKRQIEAIARIKPDVVICGEVQEWETAEYIRDARAAGKKVSLIIMGHVASEEPGSEWMASWLRKYISGVTVTHIPTGNVFMYY